MQNVICYADNKDLGQYMSGAFSRHLPNPIDVNLSPENFRISLLRKSFSLGIIRTQHFDEITLKLIEFVRSQDLSFPIMVIAEKIKTSTMDALYNMSDVHIMMSPFTEKAFIGLTRKLLIARKVPKQFFRRFTTHQIAQIEPLSTGNTILSCMYNLSKGGAYCEFESDESITVGDIIKFRVNLEDNNKEHFLNAKVVWTTTKGRYSGRFGFGFKFVSSKDTYRSMMSKM